MLWPLVKNPTRNASATSSSLFFYALSGKVSLLFYTAVSTKAVQLKSIKAYATIPKGMMDCGCSLLHPQVHEFSAGWKEVL